MSQQLTFGLCGCEVKGAPLLKWPGGKRNLLKHILPLLPVTFNRYYEPFAGGAALFFALQPKIAVLSDNNPDLINCYIQVRDRPDEVIARLKKLKNTEQDYYKIRGKVPTDEVARAARFIYLLSLSFNGIHRSNLKGEFNVPYGYNADSQFCDTVKILAASAALSSAELKCEDFESSVASAENGDVVYLDPPYTVAHGKNGFIKYNAKIFSWDDQIRLANLARNLIKRGCKVIISNAHHSSILNIYKDFKLELIRRTSTIAASGEFRRQIEECLFHNELNTYVE
jgi:DNA adenine methylase